jgi:hypothetical protein
VDADSGSDTWAGTEVQPYKTVEKGVTSAGSGGKVYLKASHNYILTSLYNTVSYNYWTTVTPAPGVTRDQVKIAGYNEAGTSTGRYGDGMILWKNLAFYTDIDTNNFHTIFYINSGQKCWFNFAELYDVYGRWNGAEAFNNQGGKVYVTNSYFHDLANGVGGLRNNYIRNICSDVYRPGNNLLSVNLTVDGIDPGSTGAHPDFWQCYCTDGVKENAILYNCRAYNMTAQGIFGCNAGCGLQDVAFVNVLLEKDPPNSALTSQTGYMQHVLVWHFTTVDQGWIFPNDTTVGQWNVKNCNFANFNAAAETTLLNSDIDYNHFGGLAWNQPKPMGAHATVGAQVFADTANDDYRVTSASPCYQSGIPLPGVPADIDGNLYHPSAPDRGCFSSYQVGIRPDKRYTAALTGAQLYISANPLRLGAGKNAVIRLELVRPQAVRAAVVDEHGSMVRVLTNGQCAGGLHTWTWDGRGADGRPVTGNLFFVHITTATGNLVKPVLVLP